MINKNQEQGRESKDGLARLVRTLGKVPAEQMDIKETPHGVYYTNNEGMTLSVSMKSGVERYDEHDIYAGNDVHYTVRIRDKDKRLLLQRTDTSYALQRARDSIGERLYSVLNGKMWDARRAKERKIEQSREKEAVDKILGEEK